MSRIDGAEGMDGFNMQTARNLLALSVEFVAKPETARNVELQLPEALRRTLEEVGGFAGSMVMISDQESRLVTVITFWSGADRVRRCAENRRWVQALLKPYVDGCVRGRTFLAHGLQAPPRRANVQPALREEREAGMREEAEACAA